MVVVWSQSFPFTGEISDLRLWNQRMVELEGIWELFQYNFLILQKIIDAKEWIQGSAFEWHNFQWFTVSGVPEDTFWVIKKQKQDSYSEDYICIFSPFLCITTLRKTKDSILVRALWDTNYQHCRSLEVKSISGKWAVRKCLGRMWNSHSTPHTHTGKGEEISPLRSSRMVDSNTGWWKVTFNSTAIYFFSFTCVLFSPQWTHWISFQTLLPPLLGICAT